MTLSTQPPRHLDALTGLRGIAAWMVVLYHIRLSLTGLFPAPVIAGLGTDGYGIAVGAMNDLLKKRKAET